MENLETFSFPLTLTFNIEKEHNIAEYDYRSDKKIMKTL